MNVGIVPRGILVESGRSRKAMQPGLAATLGRTLSLIKPAGVFGQVCNQDQWGGGSGN